MFQAKCTEARAQFPEQRCVMVQECAELLSAYHEMISDPRAARSQGSNALERLDWSDLHFIPSWSKARRRFADAAEPAGVPWPLRQHRGRRVICENFRKQFDAARRAPGIVMGTRRAGTLDRVTTALAEWRC